MTEASSQKEQLRVGTKDKSVPWYSPELTTQVTPQARELLVNYSHIPPEEVNKHIYDIREHAWDIFPYPCIGLFFFLDFSLSLHPYYPTVVSRLKERTHPQALLDLGCCFAQDVRKLVADCVPSEQVYACDLRGEFFKLGYELFRDQETLRSHFFQADVFASADEEAGKGLAELDGKVDIVHASAFLHLFNWDDQIKACERIVKLLKPVKDSVVLGRQIGVEKVERPQTAEQGRKMHRHDEDSFKEMWEEVGKRTGSRWRVEVEALVVGNTGGKLSGSLFDEKTRRLRFAVFREE